MKLVREHMNEAIKHLPGRSQEELAKLPHPFSLSNYFRIDEPEYKKVIKTLNCSADDLILIREGIANDSFDVINFPFIYNEQFNRDHDPMEYLQEYFFSDLLDNEVTSKIITAYEYDVTERTPKTERYEKGDWICYPKKQIAIWHDCRHYTYDAIIFHKKYFNAMIQSVNNYAGETKMMVKCM